MEMVQFHPTGLVIPGSLMTGALLEEGLRGAGGHLRNGLGERYMERWDPERKERSTRDLVSRASFLEIQAGRGTPNGAVWIDVSHLGAPFVEQTFRGMVKRCRDFGRDLARQPVEVGPTAHFTMGGVVIDPSCRTSMEALFAAGEDAGGVHGANRLGGNGVAESTVFGGIAGDVMAAFVEGRPMPSASVDHVVETARTRATAPLARHGGPDLYRLQRELRTVMWEKVGLVRDGDGLRAAVSEIDRIADALEHVAIAGGPAFNMAWQDWLNLMNQAEVARLIALSALARRESRGAHYRVDYPDTASGVPVVVRIQRVGDDPSITRAPVAFTRASPDRAGSTSYDALVGERGDLAG
jgi:succinate dehydrogenase / fumarate reductase flavoprotein subunit/fumarate reductase flavoprotein subunit